MSSKGWFFKTVCIIILLSKDSSCSLVVVVLRLGLEQKIKLSFNFTDDHYFFHWDVHVEARGSHHQSPPGTSHNKG